MTEELWKLTPYQRRKRYHQEHPDAFRWDEGEALSGVQSREKPTEETKEETQVNAFQKLIEQLPREEIERLIDEYGDDESFVQFASKQIAPKEDNQEALKAEYLARFAKIPAGRSSRPYEVKRLREEMRAKGLKEL